MSGRIVRFIREYIRENSTILFFLFILFVIGIILGAFAANTLNSSQKVELYSYINGFFKAKDVKITNGELFLEILLNNTKFIAIIWFLGAVLFGGILVFGLFGFKGFSMGFTISILYQLFMNVKGLSLVLLLIIPQVVILLPCIIVLSISSIKLSSSILKTGSIKSNTRQNEIVKKLILHTILTLGILILISLEALIEMLFQPIITNLIVSNFITLL